MCALADVVNFIRGRLEKAGLIGRGTWPPKAPDALVPELARVADTLANHAVADLRSQDNVTVMIVYLRNAHGRAGRPVAVVLQPARARVKWTDWKQRTRETDFTGQGSAAPPITFVRSAHHAPTARD